MIPSPAVESSTIVHHPSSESREAAPTSMASMSLSMSLGVLARHAGTLAQADDWSGLTDPVERRRRQNRINQRTYRRRKRQRSTGPEARMKTADIIGRASWAESESDYLMQQIQQAYGHGHPPDSIPTVKNGRSSSSVCCLAPPEARQLMDQFERAAYRSYLLGHPTADHLLRLTKVNVYRAFVSNISALGLTMDWMLDDDTLSPFNTLRPDLPVYNGEGSSSSSSIPPNLLPTQLQRIVPHHPWLDFFPLPQIRDNLLRAGNSFDDEELCVDVLGFWDLSGGEKSLIVWGDPWDPHSWEITEAFVKKWGWVVRGCTEILRSTNHWREKRGERKLFTDIP